MIKITWLTKIRYRKKIDEVEEDDDETILILTEHQNSKSF